MSTYLVYRDIILHVSHFVFGDIILHVRHFALIVYIDLCDTQKLVRGREGGGEQKLTHRKLGDQQLDGKIDVFV